VCQSVCWVTFVSLAKNGWTYPDAIWGGVTQVDGVQIPPREGTRFWGCPAHQKAWESLVGRFMQQSITETAASLPPGRCHIKFSPSSWDLSTTQIWLVQLDLSLSRCSTEHLNHCLVSIRCYSWRVSILPYARCSAKCHVPRNWQAANSICSCETKMKINGKIQNLLKKKVEIRQWFQTETIIRLVIISENKLRWKSINDILTLFAV